MGNWHKQRLDHKGRLPPIVAFYSSLEPDDEYTYSKQIYTTLNCNSFNDFHLTYPTCDVLLIADVYAHFRQACFKSYNVDPTNYLTAQGLAWDVVFVDS